MVKPTIYVVLCVGIHILGVILFLPLVVRPSRIRGYALSHSAEVTHSFIQQSPSLPMMADKDVPRRSDRLTKEEKVNHTKQMRAMNELQASLDHPAPASMKKRQRRPPRRRRRRTNWFVSTSPMPVRTAFLKVENMLQEDSLLQENLCVKMLQLLS